MTAPITKARSRGRPKKLRPEFAVVEDDDEREPSKPVTRARSSRRPRMRQNQGGSSPRSHNLAAQEKHSVFDDNNRWSPSFEVPSDGGAVLHYERKKRRGSRLPECHTSSSDVKRRRPTTDRDDLVIDIGSSPRPSQSAQFAATATPLGQDVPNDGGSQQWSLTRDSLFGWVKDLFRFLDHSGEASQFCSKVTQFLDFQAKETQVVVAKLKDEHKSMDEVHKSLDEVISVLQTDVTALQRTNKKLSAKNLRLEQRVCRQDGKRQVDDSEVSVHPTKHGHSRCRKQISHKDAEIQSLKENIRELTVRLQQQATVDSQRCESDCVTLNPLRLQYRPGDDTFSGSYADGSATPNQLQTALCITKAAVTSFQMEFAKDTEIASTRLERKGLFMAKPYHFRFFVRAGLYEVLFEGFENEGFNTCNGVSRFPDPELRRAKFFEYYIREESSDFAPDIMDDPQFEEFYGKRVSLLWEKLPPMCDGKSLEEIGWTPALDLSFKDAARSVWLLHKLAFAFEPPVSIFRVGDGAAFDSKYMELVVDRDEDERFILKVGTMVAPGLRLRNSVIRCEVYLAGAAPTPEHIEP